MIFPAPDLLARAAHGASVLPQAASSAADRFDPVSAFVFWVCAFFLALITALVTFFVVRYRRRPSRLEPEASPDHATRLEILWTAIPLALVVAMFAMSAKAYYEVTGPAGENALRVNVTGRRWSWWFDHPGGKGSNELHLVQGRPAELVMASTDVVHSLYVPEFRLKQDVVPGRYTRLAFTPTVAGSFPVLCAEFCGTDHSRMLTKVVVHPDQASFDSWSQEGRAAGSLADVGKALMAEKGCIACHSDDGSPGVGPSFKNLWGKQEKLAGGATVRVDEDYVRESVSKPDAKIVDGFQNLMPPVPLEERELQAIIAYIKSLKDAP